MINHYGTYWLHSNASSALIPLKLNNSSETMFQCLEAKMATNFNGIILKCNLFLQIYENNTLKSTIFSIILEIWLLLILNLA